MRFLSPSDLEPFATIDEAKAIAMIEDAEATAATVAPCITEGGFLEDDTRVAYVRAVIRAAVLRWNESGSGAFQTQTAGPFSVGMDTRQERRGMFWPSEISQLQDACKRYRGGGGSKAYSVPFGRGDSFAAHSDVCDLVFGALRCSCGSNINGFAGPLYEGGEIS